MQYTGSVSYKDIKDRQFVTMNNIDNEQIMKIIAALDKQNVKYSAQYDNKSITVTFERSDADPIRGIINSAQAQPTNENSVNKSDEALEELRKQILQIQKSLETQEQSASTLSTEVKPEHACLLPIIDAKVLKQEQKLETLNDRKSVQEGKISEYHSRIDKLTEKAGKITAVNAMLAELMNKGKLPAAVKNSIRGIIRNNEVTVAKIRNKSIPKLEGKIEKRTEKIAGLDKRINLAQCKIDRYKSLNDVIKSFTSFDKDRFSAALDDLHNNSAALLNAKIDVCHSKIMQLTKIYKENPVSATSLGIPLEITKLRQREINLIRKRNKLLGVSVSYAAQPDNVKGAAFEKAEEAVNTAVKQDVIEPVNVADSVVEAPISVIPQHVIITPPPENDYPLLLPEIATVMDTSVSELESKPKDVKEMIVSNYINSVDAPLETVQESLSAIITPNVRVNENLDSKKEENEVKSNQKQLDTRNGLVSAALSNGEVVNFRLNEQITSQQALETLANAESPFIALREIGKQVTEMQAAEFEQSDKCGYSITANFNDRTAKLYEINGGIGGISETDRNDNNISFSNVDLNDYSKNNPLKTTEELIEVNANMIDGIINNEPPKKEPKEQKQQKQEPHKAEKQEKKPFTFSRSQLKRNAKRVSEQHKSDTPQHNRKPPEH